MKESSVHRDKIKQKQKGPKHHWTPAEDRALIEAVTSSPSYQKGKKLEWTAEIWPLFDAIRKRNLGEEKYYPRKPKDLNWRYKKYLAPNVDNSSLSKEEAELLERKYKELGLKWAEISKFFNKRTDNHLKNYFNKHIKNKTQNQQVKESASNSPHIVEMAPIESNHNENDKDMESILSSFTTEDISKLLKEAEEKNPLSF